MSRRFSAETAEKSVAIANVNFMYMIFVMGFAQCKFFNFVTLKVLIILEVSAYFIVYQSYDGDDGNMMETAAEAIIQCFIMSMGSFGGIWSSLEDTNHAIIGKV